MLHTAQHIVGTPDGVLVRLLLFAWMSPRTLWGVLAGNVQVDSLATKRADDMNEATRRLLGVLLRFIDGFKATDSIVIGATNRQQVGILSVLYAAALVGTWHDFDMTLS